jgi:adenylate kinase family enzyme
VRRINVVGSSGSGKTTTGAELARRLGVPLVELDSLSWEPNWVAAPIDVLRERVAAAVSGETWVVDGNYGVARDLVWARADTVVWLDLSLWIVMWRVCSRTVRRLVRREVLWNGNRESMRTTLSRDSIILYALTEFRRRRRELSSALAAQPHLGVVRLTTAGDVERFLAAIPTPASMQPGTRRAQR